MSFDKSTNGQDTEVEVPDTEVERVRSKQRADDCASILSMLTYRRPHKTKTERKFIKRFLIPLGVRIDAVGNAILRIGDEPIMWSSHTDTVHSQPGRQHVKISGREVSLKSMDSSCLGADCTAGVWIMTEMIKANVPGLYIFHAGEEVGCVGSRHIAKNTPEILSGIKMAVAFDRKGKDEIITHQRSSRCCSEEFALSFAEAIGMGYKPSPNGIFTDTANYTDLIGECSNISVGYEGAHSRSETLNIEHLFSLRDAIVGASFSGLVTKRSPGEVEKTTYSYRRGRSYSYHDEWGGDLWGGHHERQNFVYDRSSGAVVPKKTATPTVLDDGSVSFRVRPKATVPLDDYFLDNENFADGRFVAPRNRSLLDLVKEHPDVAADILDQLGVDERAFLEEVWGTGGYR